MSDELLSALDESGSALPKGVLRKDAHRGGIWHESVSVVILNTHGEILLEKRSEHKDLFPGRFDIPGGHVRFGSNPIRTAREELREELGLDVPPARILALTKTDGLLERVVLPEKGIVNLERKTAFLVEIEPAEEAVILTRAARWSHMSPAQLANRGAYGEVSSVEFWPWERIHHALRDSHERVLASGTETTLTDETVRKRVWKRCVEIRGAVRREFCTRYGNLFGIEEPDAATDEVVLETLRGVSLNAASDQAVAAIFDQGVEQPAGAYRLGSFRLAASGDEHWEPKLHDPERQYVDNLISAFVRGCDTGAMRRFSSRRPEVREFVTAALNLPLENGRRLRDELGNLADIAVASRAVQLWLRHNAGDLFSEDDLAHPIRAFVSGCLNASRTLLEGCLPVTSGSGLARTKQLLFASLGAAGVDYNSPELQKRLTAPAGRGLWILDFARKRRPSTLFEELGGDGFLEEFHARYIDQCRASVLAFLPGNATQAYLSLALCQEWMRLNPKLEILFLPKSGAPGCDLSFEDTTEILGYGVHGPLSELVKEATRGRFHIIPDGPSCHGLDPGRLSYRSAKTLYDADVIFAEGQAYAEIRGWKKPVYASFRVNGRVAEALHGVSQQAGECAVVRLTPGVDHFEGFESAVTRRVLDKSQNTLIPACSQTTSDYVSAILGENFRLLVEILFQGDQNEACRQIREEARRLGRTFAQVVIGTAAAPPAEPAVREHFQNRECPIFACGGGGGFSGVTLKALRKLGLAVAAGVPSTDDGGSTGDLQRWLHPRRGFVFGVGDLAGIVQDSLENRGKQAVLAYRFDSEPIDLARAVLERIAQEMVHPTYADSMIGSAPDFLSFACDQMNFARLIDRSFRSRDKGRLAAKGASVRNLNVLAAFELCAALGSRKVPDPDSRMAALYVLEKALGADSKLLVLPVTYDECALYVDYEDPIPAALKTAFHLPRRATANRGCRLIGQRFIDKLPHDGRRRSAGVFMSCGRTETKPVANPEYLSRLRSARLVIMGAGSLFSSQLAQITVPGVVDALLGLSGARRILVLNHVKMDETRGMSVADHIRVIENAATDSLSPDGLEKYVEEGGRLKISQLFTDIVVPRTVAAEIEDEMREAKYQPDPGLTSAPTFVELVRPDTAPVRILRNRYVDFLLTHAGIQQKLAVTSNEMEVLSYLDQPPSLYSGRKEAGRYRGALYATRADLEYLEQQGIQPRSIHVIDSIGRNWKVLKSEGAPSLEFFPGLVSEALMGIIQIALERGADAAKTQMP